MGSSCSCGTSAIVPRGRDEGGAAMWDEEDGIWKAIHELDDDVGVGFVGDEIVMVED